MPLVFFSGDLALDMLYVAFDIAYSVNVDVRPHLCKVTQFRL